MLDPIQNEFNNSPEWQEIEKKAYPSDQPKEKKTKPKKDKGSKHPGKAAVEQQAEEGKDVNVSGATAADVGTSASEAMGKLNVS